MVEELRVRNAAQQLYTRALSSAWRNGIQVYDPSVWLTRDPEAEEKMLRDADIAHAIEYRQQLVAGRQWNVVPKRADDRAEMATHVGTQLLTEIERFTASRMTLARAFFHGARFARIHGEIRTLTIGDGKPRKWWVPVRLEDIDKRSFRKVSSIDPETQALSAHWEQWDVGAATWRKLSATGAIDYIKHVYQDEAGTLGYGRALREALGWWWYAKEHVFAESMQAVERFAQGIVHVKIDGARDGATGLPNEELIRSWMQAIENMRARHTIVSDRSDEIEIISGSGTGWEMLASMRNELRNSIMTLVLGANLTTGADKGGSYALAAVQENSTESLVQFDREVLEETLTRDLLGACWWHNYVNVRELGIVGEMPRFNIAQEKRLDPMQRAQVAQTLVNIGVPLASDEVYEQAGFRKPEASEDVIAPRPAQPPPQFEVP